jgi:formylglycine-generating enzyme required for sulfatase activity
VDQVRLRVSRTDQGFEEAIALYLQKLNYLESNPPQITYTTDILETIDDSLVTQQPSPSSCSGGTIAYEQLVNYKTDGFLLVQSNIFDSLSDSAKAALVFHEAVYKYRRDITGDTNSVNSRRIVGLIFSTLSTDDLQEALADINDSGMDVNGLRFISIQPGSFVMGTPSDHPDGNETQHLVTLTRPIEIQATDITQAQYTRIMGVNPSIFQTSQACPKSFKVVQGLAMCPNNPVENVSWDDVQNFLAKLNSTSSDGYTYRLPTEAEWEYAARAGTSTTYSFGDGADLLSFYGWYGGSSWLEGNSANHTHEVAQLKPNAFGLYDMQGNVWQWVSDTYESFEAKPVVDPIVLDGAGRVLRGGSYIEGAQSLTAGHRSAVGVQFQGYPDVGFRVVRTR